MEDEKRNPGLKLEFNQVHVDGLFRALQCNFDISQKSSRLLQGLTKLGIIARQHQLKNVFDSAESAERVRTTALEIGNIRNYLPQDTPFVILVVPARFEVRDQHPYFRSLRLALLAELAKENIPTIDLYPAFEEAGLRQLTLPMTDIGLRRDTPSRQMRSPLGC